MKHIIKSMTVHNVPYEMFSTFSATFEEVRKVSRILSTCMSLTELVIKDASYLFP